MSNNRKSPYKSINTPICDFLDGYTAAGTIRLHMPGHKGKGDAESSDITEIYGADSLYEANGIIAESEKNAGEIFGAHTFYSCEGSSLSIRAMLRLICIYAYEKNEKPTVSAARNVHKSFISAVALQNIDVNWIVPNSQDNYLTCKLNSQDVINHFSSLKKLPTALYLTSPDYLGNVTDIKGIAEVCHKYGVLLIVDNAHGAYLKFLDKSIHPIDLGADMCADSAHKTLNALTGAAYLHVSNHAPEIFSQKAKDALALFGSTSPSYLILQSLDKLNPYLKEEYQSNLIAFCDKLHTIKSALESSGYVFLGDEPLKFTIDAKKYGYYGIELAQILRKENIETEFADKDYLTAMFTPQISDEELEKVKNVLMSIPQKEPIIDLSPHFHLPKIAMPVYEAYRKPSEAVALREAIGRTVAETNEGCPPAVPIIVAGEIIDENAVKTLEYYGKSEISVIK